MSKNLVNVKVTYQSEERDHALHIKGEVSLFSVGDCEFKDKLNFSLVLPSNKDVGKEVTSRVVVEEICSECGFSYFRRYDEQPLSHCPVCGNEGSFNPVSVGFISKKVSVPEGSNVI